MYDRILIPFDGSVGAHRGMDQGLDIAEETGAEVHAMFVVDERRFGDSPAISSDELFLEHVEVDGEARLAELVTEAEARGLAVATACRRGNPAECLIEYAMEHDIDLIVTGLHGRSRRTEPKIGSTTKHLLKHAPMPVMPV